MFICRGKNKPDFDASNQFVCCLPRRPRRLPLPQSQGLLYIYSFLHYLFLVLRNGYPEPSTTRQSPNPGMLATQVDEGGVWL